MQLISLLMLGRSISQTSSRQTLWVQWAMNQDLPLPHSTFSCLLSLLSLNSFPPCSVLLCCPSLLHNTHLKMQLYFDNTRRFRSQQLLLFNATLNPPLIIFFSFVQLQVCLFHACDSLMVFWWPKKTIAPSKNELSDPLDALEGISNVKQNHLQ